MDHGINCFNVLIDFPSLQIFHLSLQLCDDVATGAVALILAFETETTAKEVVEYPPNRPKNVADG